MKTIKKLISLTIFAVMLMQAFALSTVQTFASENLINNISSNNWGMYATPVKNEIKIDASFDDWDWSPRIKMFPDYDAQSSMGAEACVNYDANNLYLGFIVRDATPLNNTIDPDLEWSITWRGDCFQLRFTGDHNSWCTFAYHRLTDQYSMLIDDISADAKSTLYSTMYISEPGSTQLTKILQKKDTPRPGGAATGIEMCAKVDTQVGDNVANYEIKLPKSAIFYEASEPYKAGNIVKMGIECYWSNDTGRAIATNYKDNLQTGSYERDFFWTAYKSWGNVELVAENDIETRNYVKDVVAPMSGYFNVDLEVDKNAKFLTVTIDDKEGHRVRNLIAELEIDPEMGSAYIVEEKENTKIVRVQWDGRNNTGGKVEPGTYYFNGITHEGIAPIYDYHYYAPGEVPWNNANISAGWLCDHNPPEAAFAYDDEVYFAGHFAEGGHGLMAYDAKTQSKKWGITYGGKLVTANEKYIYAQPGWTFTFSSAITGNKMTARYNRADGTYVPFSVFGNDQKVEYGNNDLLGVLNGQSTPWITGLAANDEILVVASSDSARQSVGSGSNAGRYPVEDPKYKNYISGVSLLRHDDMHVFKRIAVDDIGQICFTKDYQHLYAASGNSIVEINLSSGEVLPVNLQLGNAVVGPIATDNDNNILIFDKGEDCQIKAFNPKTGKIVYTIGKKGGRSYDGAWEAEGFIKQVTAITAGYEGRVWAVECFESPRRITEWSKDGELLYEMVGNTQYMGIGTGLHDSNPDVAYYQAAEMAIDRENNTYKMNRVLYIPDMEKHELFPIKTGQQIGQYFKSSASGEEHEYVYADRVLYIEGEDGRFRPCFSTGTIGNILNVADSSSDGYFQNYDPSRANEYNQYWSNVFSGCNESDKYIWNDLNMDGIVQREECDIYPEYADVVSTYSRAIFRDNTGRPTSALKVNNRQITAKDLVENPDYYRTMVPDLYFDDGTPAYYYNDDGSVSFYDATTTHYENYYQMTATSIKRYDYKWLGNIDIPNGTYWDQRITNDTMQWAGCTGTRIGVWTPARFNENGAPIYTMGDSVHFLDVGAKMGTSCILTEGNDNLLVCPTDQQGDYYGNAMKCYNRYTGELIWNYRNDYPGVHGSHSSGMQEKYGVMIGTLKMLGTFHNNEGDKFTVIRGNQGCDYVMTEDGYFVSTLFKDNRLVALALPSDMKPGKDMNEYTEGPEPFGGNGSTHTDGASRYIISTGGRVAIVVRLEGMDTIKQFKTVPLTVSLKDLEACYAWTEPKKDNDTGITTEKLTQYEIKYAAKGFNLDGASDDWAGYQTLRTESDGVTEYADVRLAWNERNLYAIYEVRDDSPMVNGAPEFQRLFKFGDVCDIFMSASANKNVDAVEGDIRIMLSVYNGEPVAVLMKHHDSLATGLENAQFSSPVTTLTYDTVKIMTDAKVVINKTETGYILEAEIPWSALNYSTPTTETKMTGDVGIVTGDEFGSKNLARVCYFNKDTGLTSDIPGEAKCYPNLWGGITFSKDDPSELYWETFGGQ